MGDKSVVEVYVIKGFALAFTIRKSGESITDLHLELSTKLLTH